MEALNTAYKLLLEEISGGIVAGVMTYIVELGLNIDDISNCLDEFFTMMAVVSSDEKQDFTQLKK